MRKFKTGRNSNSIEPSVFPNLGFFYKESCILMIGSLSNANLCMHNGTAT